MIDFAQLTLLEEIKPKVLSGDIEYEIYTGLIYNSQKVCIKKYKRRAKVQDSKLIREAKRLSSLNNPNIVMFMGLSLEKDFIYQISEFMQEGSVFDQVHVNKKLSMHNMRNMFDLLESVAKGMNYLHGLKKIHGNLNSTSILIDEDWNYKISDFGFSKLRERCHRLKRSKFSAYESPYWFAPEIFRGERFGPNCDVYSFGILLWYESIMSGS